jgi:hypothetical protein
MKYGKIIKALVFFIAVSHLPALQAQQGPDKHPLLDSRFVFSVGAFANDQDFKLRVDGQDAGTGIDLNNDWGVSTTDTSLSATLRWRFGKKWSVSGQYFDTSNSGRAELERDVEWGDYIFKSGTNVGAGIELTVGRLFFGRTFSTGDRHEFGLGAGLHWLEIDAFVDGEAFVNDESSGFRRESVSAGAPLPNIGAWYDYAFTPIWLMRARVDWLSASFDEYSGSLLNGSVGINFQPWRHVGFDLSYQYFALDVDVDKSDWHGAADLSFQGPYLSLNLNW